MSEYTGSITPNGVILETHEMATVVFLTEIGFDIELIPKSNIEGIHSPDIIMAGHEWEMKSPTGEGKWLIKNTFQTASRQSENIIIDLRRIKLPQERCLRELNRQFSFSKRVKRMWIITKAKKLLVMEK